MTRPIEFDQTFAFIAKVLRLIGYPSCLVPYPDNVTGRLKSNAPFIVCFLMLAYCVLGQIINIIRLMTGARKTDEVVEEVAIQISSTGFCIIGLAKMHCLAYNRDILTRLIADFRTKWDDQDLTPGDLTIRDGALRPTVTITTMAAVGNIVMVSAFNFLPVAEMIYTGVAKSEWIRLFPYVIWFPFESTGGLQYYLVYLFEVYSGNIVAVGNVGFNCIFCLLTSHLTMQLKLLRNWIENVVETQDERSLGRSKEKFRRVVQYHQDVLRCRDELQAMFSTTLFLNFSASSILMCMQGYVITTAGFTLVVKFTLFMLCILMEIFILCYYGEEISVNSKAIASGAFNCNWYHGEASGRDPRFGKNLIPIIQRAQIPMVLTAWKFWPITINTFSRILQSSWSYFTLLKTVMP
ncbi:odorant receptor 4-like [Ochlerotatus camptorhynchus]|uniref:odorant receptor 4-like n=1 Tax=Ochlerotatus camptorhynchus TaxID=644619 RepID=UPI0031CE8BD2